jgi:hypothetical protein
MNKNRRLMSLSAFGEYGEFSVVYFKRTCLRIRLMKIRGLGDEKSVLGEDAYRVRAVLAPVL